MIGGSPGELPGVVVEQEARELQRYLDGWIEQGVFREGSITWDPEASTHWVEVCLATGHSRGWSTEQFRGYIQGLVDATRYHRRKEKW